MKTLKKARLQFLIIFALFIAATIIYVIMQPKRLAEAAWFDDAFAYRQTVAIANAGSAQTDYQVSFTLNTAALIAAGKMQSTCNDIRITDMNGKILPVWIEENNPGCNNAATVIWTKVPSVPTSGTAMYVYYGNPSAISVASGDNTFLLFEDFNSGALDASKWTSINAPTIGFAGGAITITSPAGATLRYIQSSTYTVNQNVAIRTRQQNPSLSVTYPGEFAFGVRSGASANVVGKIVYSGSNITSVTNNNTTETAGGSHASDTSYHVYDLTWLASQSILKQDGTTLETLTTTIPNTSLPITAGKPDYGPTIQQNQTTLDWIVVRKYTTTEPTTATPTNEEQSPAPVAYWKFDEGQGVTANNSAWQKTGTTTNLDSNPSLETNITGWSGWDNSGTATRERSTEKAAFGQYSFKQTVTVDGGQEGDSYGANVTEGSTYSMSFWVNIPSVGVGESVPFYFREYYDGGNSILSTIATITAVTSGWVRYSITTAIPVASRTNTRIELSFYTQKVGTVVYVDGVQIEQTSSVTGYCDGSLTGNGSHVWNGTAHASTSTCDTGTDGSISGSTWQTEDQCVSGKCLYFNGSSNTIALGSNQTFATGAWSVSLWFNSNKMPTGTAGTDIQNFIGTPTTTMDSQYFAIRAKRVAIWDVSNAQWYSSNTDLTANTWYNVTLAYDGNGIYTVYLNGQTDSSWGSLGTTDDDLIVNNIGAFAGTSRYFYGKIDDVKIYSYARTTAQIKADFLAKGSGSVKGSSVQIGSNPKNSDALSNGLVGYWKMDETSGDALDTSGNSNTAVPTGTTVVTGKFGNGRQVGQTGNYFTTTAATSLNFTTQTTFSSWVYVTSYITPNGVARITGRSDSSFELAVDSGGSGIGAQGNLAIYTPTTSWVTTGAAGHLSLNTWYRVTSVFDGTNHKVYINDSLVWTSANTTINIGGNLLFGAATGGTEGVTGTIDDVRIYNRALSPSEISTLYNWAPGPFLYYKFDEKTGVNANDSSGNGLTGTIGNSMTWDTGKFGSSLNNTSGGDNDTTVTTQLYKSLGGLTYEGWIYPTNNADTTQLIGFSGTGAAGEGWELDWDTSGTIKCYIGTSGAWANTSYSTSNVSLNTWHHISCSWDGSNIRNYIDGVLVAGPTPKTGNLSSSTWNATHIGAYQSAGYGFYGKIDEFKLYNYARTSKQITEDMNAGHPVGGSPVGSQVGYWKFDEGYSNITNNSGSVGSTLNGSISGATWSNNGKFGRALSFDGTNNLVQTTTGASSISSDFTYSIFIYPTQNNDGLTRGIVGNLDYSPTKYGASIVQLNQNLYVYWGAGADNYAWSSKITNINTWYHIVLTYTSGVLRLYINGVLQTGTSTQTINQNNTKFTIGRWDQDYNDYYFKGLIDEVKIYSSALTADEIKLDYNHGQSMVLGSLSNTSGLTGGSVASNSASAQYCVPGDNTTCSPPVGEWNFEEGTGGTTNDTSGNANTGTWGGTGSHWTTGKIGKAGNFNGSDDYVSIPNASNFYSTSGVTIFGWLKTSSTATFKDTLSVKCYYGVYYTNGQLIPFFDGSGGSDPAWSSGLNDNKWHFISAVNNNGTTSLYVDGIFINSRSESLTNINGVTDTSAIGNHCDLTGSYDFPGQLDNFKIFNYARTPAQIAYDYNRGGPVAQWKFDECQGTAANDSSGNGNTGTITIGATVPQTAAGTCTDGLSTSAWNNGKTGKYNSSLRFDGQDDYMTRNMSVSASDGTVAFWVKDFAAGVGPYLFRSDANLRTYVGVTGSQIYFYKGNPAVVVPSTPALTTSNWNHVVLKWWTTGGIQYAEAYANGVSTGSPVTFLDTTAGSYITVAGFSPSGTQNAAGQIDDVQVYNYALTPAQIGGLYNQNSAIRFGPVTGTP